MCMVIDLGAYRKRHNLGTICSQSTNLGSSTQCPMWTIENIKINQEKAFVDDSARKVRKYAPDPIKNIDDINRILDYFLFKGQYRNLLLFTMGINFGLRCGDLLKLKFGHVMDIDGNIKSKIVLEEEKTRRKENKKKNIKAKCGHIRTCYMNDFVVSAIQLYVDSLANKREIDLNSYLFTSLSKNNSTNYYDTLHCKSLTTTGKPLQVKRDINTPISVKSVEKMLKKTINDELGIDVHAGTHLMRKTFAYQVITNAPDRNRAIEFLQKILGHKSPATTLYYAGITDEEIQNVCMNLYQGRIDFCYGIGLSRKVGGTM